VNYSSINEYKGANLVNQMTLIIKYTAILFLLTTAVKGVGQEQGMRLYGRTLELNLLDSSESKVGQTPLRVFRNDSLFLETESTRSGKYNCFLPFGQKYFVYYGKAPYITKIIEFDLRNIGGKTVRKGFSLDLDVAVFKSENRTLKLLHSEPVGKAAYSKRPDLIIFDPVYSQKHRVEVSRSIAMWRQNMR
jgi:hypothetical protein